MRPETIKLLKVNIGSKIPDMGLGNDFFESDTKSKGNKAKINNWDPSCCGCGVGQQL